MKTVTACWLETQVNVRKFTTARLEGYNQFSTLKNKNLVNDMNHFLFYKER